MIVRTLLLSITLVAPSAATAATCDKENPESCLEAALTVLKKAKKAEQVGKGRDILVQGCDFGHGPACVRAGSLFLDRQTTGLDEDVDRARQLFRRGCTLNDGSSCDALARSYDRARPGSKADPGQALQFYARACKMEIAPSCVAAGRMFIDGRGTPVNLQQAGTLFEQACNAQYAPGCVNLGKLFRAAKDIPGNEAKALSAYSQACRFQDLESCNEVGVAYEDGLGTEKYPERARKLYEMTCENKSGQGCALLGFMIERGATKGSVETALEYYKKGCKLKDNNACTKLDIAKLGRCPAGTSIVRTIGAYECQSPDGNKHGPYRSVYSVGRAKSIGQYKDNEMDGEWLYFFPNGKKQAEVRYSEGKREGLSRTWYATGQLESESRFVSDEPEGITKSFYPDGNKRSERFSEGGTGWVKEWHANGSPLLTGQYKNDRRIGDWTYFRSNGETLHTNALGDSGTGPFVAYDAAGAITEKGALQGGMRSGVWVFFVNGTKTSSVTYARDREEGATQFFFPDGTVRETGSFRAGKRQGEWKEHFSNGSLRFKVTYSANLPVGPATEYDSKGRVLRKVEFPNRPLDDGKIALYRDSLGIRHGTYLDYHKNGKKAVEQVWELGKLVETKRWGPDGKAMTKR
ncbi:MAG: hypothetical protein AAF654_14680 [Myxococcota bacterium]